MISVIIPVYNCEKYIFGMLESLWKQTYRNFEVICVNDGSTDNTLEILNKQQKQHPELRIITIENSGPSVARNIGIKEAKGEYICFIDADDFIDDCYLKSLYDTIIKYNTDISVCYVQRVFENRPFWIEKKFPYIQNKYMESPTSIEENKEVLINLLNAPFAKLIRRDFLVENKIQFIKGKIAQDFLFTKTMLLYGATVSLCPEVNYHYLVRRGSITTSRLDKAYDLADVYDALIDLSRNLDKFEKYYNELEYLCIYHIGIDMAWRLFRGKRGIFRCLKDVKSILKKYGFKTKNKYVKNLSWFVRVYLLLLN